MRSPASHVLLTLLLLLPASRSAWAQELPANTTPTEQAPAAPQQATPAPPQDTPSAPTEANTIRRNARLVVLDAVVLDKKGNAVTGLTRDDFHVTDNNDPEILRYFDAPGAFAVPSDATVDSTADLERVAPRAPVNIVLLDEFNTLFEDEAFARYCLKKWLDSQPDKLTTPTMLIAVDLEHFTVLRDYTQNKQEILEALDHHFVANPWRQTQNAWKSERRATAFLTLRRVAEATVGHQGHKNMIWLGRGFPTSRRVLASADEESSVHSAVERAVNQLRDARVTLYTIDPAGVQTDPFKYGEAAGLLWPFGGNPDFQQLARSTGGRNLYGRNDVDAEIGTAIRDGSSLYTLVYRPGDEQSGGNEYHAIHVTTSRPDLTVVTRLGYFPERRPARLRADGTMGKNLAKDLAGASHSNMAYDSVPFSVQPSSEPGSYLVHVDPQALVWSIAHPGEPRHARIILVVTTFDKKGKELNHEARDVTASAPDTAPPSGTLERSINIDYKLADDSKNPKAPKAARVRFVVRVETTGRIGTVDLPLGPYAPLTAVSSRPTDVTQTQQP